MLVGLQDFHRQLHGEGRLKEIPSTGCFGVQRFLDTPLNGRKPVIGQNQALWDSLVQAERNRVAIDRVEARDTIGASLRARF